jgi:hypothetical protein
MSQETSCASWFSAKEVGIKIYIHHVLHRAVQIFRKKKKNRAVQMSLMVLGH